MAEDKQEMKWTAGPWLVSRTNLVTPFNSIVFGVDFFWSPHSKKADIANLQLASAAPELYEAVANLMGILDTPIGRRKNGLAADDDVLTQARAALRKAKGEDNG